ncbi:MAG: SpoIID/LytB domain-containing protein [Thermodesulfobacteriota bacterium]|nr:MAG: SpoIID/LytB domain-containing protein [Thermodesulfobacteriota bacterium]
MKKIFRIGFASLLLFIPIFFMHSSPARAGEKIRVLVAGGLDTVKLSNTRWNGRVEIKRSKTGVVSVNGRVKRLPLKFYAGNSFLYFNNRPFRGSISIHKDGAGLMAVNELGLEDYVTGIINYEVSSKWPLEVLKAQAVAARTYALYMKQKNKGGVYDIEGTVMGQVYRGAAAEDEAAERAVMGSRGEVLTFKGEIALTVYHSNAGGATDSAKDIWGRDYPYLRSVISPYDMDAPWFLWDFALPASLLKRVLNGFGVGVGVPVAMSVEGATPEGRVKRLKIVDRRGSVFFMSGEDLRKAIGYGVLKSARFRVDKRGDVFIFKGRGSGHGVGLSQWGARGMAENGYSYREILDYYYPGTVLERRY